MITVIAKKIDNGVSPNGGQAKYSVDLIKYMASPETSRAPRGIQSDDEKPERREKCIAMVCEGFAEENPEPIEMAAEMAADCSLSYRLRNGQGIDHWVISWKPTAGEKMTADEVLAATRDWVSDMGYGINHKWVASVHADTDHLHVHVALCRVDVNTGLVKHRGFWKRENQKSLARMAVKYGWSLEKGSKERASKTETEKVVEKNSFTGRETIRERPKILDNSLEHIEIHEDSSQVITVSPKTAIRQKAWATVISARRNRRRSQQKFHVGDKAERHEHYSGTKSTKRLLHEALEKTYNEIKDMPFDLSQLQAELALRGIEMQIKQYGKNKKRTGVVYRFTPSVDADRATKNVWYSASQVCPQMTLGKLKVPDDNWKDNRKTPTLKPIASSVPSVVPTEKTTAQINAEFSKEQIQTLRNVSVNETRAWCQEQGFKLTENPKKPKNGIDVLVLEYGYSYAKAIELLASWQGIVGTVEEVEKAKAEHAELIIRSRDAMLALKEERLAILANIKPKEKSSVILSRRYNFESKVK